MWGAAYGGGATTDGNAVLGSNNATARAFGFAAGADYRISPNTLAGFALAGGGTSFSVNGFGSGRSDLFQAGVFVRHNVGAAYVTGALAYGWQDVTTDRTVTVAGIDRLRAEFKANAFSGRFEGGYRFVTPWMASRPMPPASSPPTICRPMPSRCWPAPNNFALNYAAQGRHGIAHRTRRAHRQVLCDAERLSSRCAAAPPGRMISTPTAASRAVFQTLPGAAFIVNGAAQAPNSALATAAPPK